VFTGRADWIKLLNKVKQAADLHSSIPMQAVLLDLLKHENLLIIYRRYNSFIENDVKRYWII
tara:strand:+ start:834 stop:1019 length:186 start_codon:yes stop_codon:yes gene_type:complete